MVYQVTEHPRCLQWLFAHQVCFPKRLEDLFLSSPPTLLTDRRLLFNTQCSTRAQPCLSVKVRSFHHVS